MSHLRAFSLALAIVLLATLGNALAASTPITVVLASGTKAVSADECAMLHRGMADYEGAISPAYKAWGASQARNDCFIEFKRTTTTSADAALARGGCYTITDYESIYASFWPHPLLVRAYLKFGICEYPLSAYYPTSGQITWMSCWVDTFIAYGSGNNYCGGAPPGPSTYAVGIEDDWYWYPYATPWWHKNHGFNNTLYFPIYWTWDQW
jgi:hypothetical protein